MRTATCTGSRIKPDFDPTLTELRTAWEATAAVA
jgi:hypothetical protein